MKKTHSRILGLVCLFALLQFGVVQQAQAQVGTWDDDFIFQILSPSSIAADYAAGDACSFGGAQGWGPDVTEELEGQLVWAYDANDSLGCGPIVTDLTGKIALIRRGTCSFSLKVYNAQQAGAIAVIILNHYTTATDGPCTLYNMTPLDSAEAVTIPAIFIPRTTGEILTPVLDAGQEVYVKFAFPRFYQPSGPYHYATPVSQVDTIQDLGVTFINRTSETQSDVVVKVEITEPGGNMVTRTLTLDPLDPSASVDAYFGPYLPPAVKGEFDVLFTNSLYNESRDSIRLKFIHTDYTFATDNFDLDPGGVGTTNANFISGGFIHQEGALCVTGPEGGVATYATFGISNIDSVFVPGAPAGSTANDVLVYLYDGDADFDGTIDFSSSFDNLTQIGYGTYSMTGTEVDGELITVAITDILTGEPVPLEPRHAYYISLYYNGLEAGYGRDIRFSNTISDWDYLNYPTTPLTIGNGTALTTFSGWSGARVVQRLHLQGFDPNAVSVQPEKLDETSVAVSPNPATDLLRVDVKLENLSEVVTLTLFDAHGRAVKVQQTPRFQEGQLTMPVQDVPSGMYLLWVRTDEGMTMRKVAICH